MRLSAAISGSFRVRPTAWRLEVEQSACFTGGSETVISGIAVLPPEWTVTDVGMLSGRWCWLNAGGVDVDTDGMRITDGQLAVFESQCLAVLGCYLRQEAEQKATDPEYNGWLDRVLTVPDVEAPVLTQVHGHLIAEGLIRFEFTGRTRGLQYQLSPTGRDAVLRNSLSPPEETRGHEQEPLESVAQAA